MRHIMDCFLRRGSYAALAVLSLCQAVGAATDAVTSKEKAILEASSLGATAVRSCSNEPLIPEQRPKFPPQSLRTVNL
jgi:hypothetical protein